MVKRALWVIVGVLMLLSPSVLRADDFPVFDGHVYNGKYYPRVDVIEWSDKPDQPTYMDFHVYSKTNPLDLTFLLDQSQGKKVMLVNYYFPDRKEHQCRRVLAPGHFMDGYFVYRDGSDPDYDSVIVSMYEMPAKNGRQLISKPVKYLACTDDSDRMPASVSPPPATTGAGPNDQVRTKSDPGALKKSGVSVPFGDL